MLIYILLIILLAIFGIVFFVLYIKKMRNSRRRDSFFFHAIHEMKNPLSTVTLTSEMLYEMDTLDEKAHKLVKMIITENKRVVQTVELFLHYGRIEKDELILHIEHVDLHALLSDSLLIHEFFLENQNGTLKTDFEASKYIIGGDKIHLTNVFDNLLENARKYSEEPAEISVKTRNEGKYLVVAVSDNGIGIHPSQQKDVFKQFYRAPEIINKHSKGFGMGLFYVKYIIEKHGGYVTLDSQPGKGSCFEIYLPLISDNSSQSVK